VLVTVLKDADAAPAQAGHPRSERLFWIIGVVPGIRIDEIGPVPPLLVKIVKISLESVGKS